MPGLDADSELAYLARTGTGAMMRVGFSVSKGFRKGGGRRQGGVEDGGGIDRIIPVDFAGNVPGPRFCSLSRSKSYVTGLEPPGEPGRDRLV